MNTQRIISSVFFLTFSLFLLLIIILYFLSLPLKSRASSNTLTLHIKTQGTHTELDQLRAYVDFYKGNEKITEEKNVLFTYKNTKFTAEIVLKPEFEYNETYALFIKPEKYNGRIFCSEKIYGTICTNPQFIFKQTGAVIDLTDSLFFVGDIAPGNGRVDAQDMSLIMKNLGVISGSFLPTDLNNDGITDVIDYSLALYSLSQNITDDEVHLIPPSQPSLTSIPSPTVQNITPSPTPTLLPSPTHTPSPTATPFPSPTTIPTPTSIPRLGQNCTNGAQKVSKPLKNSWGLNVLPPSYGYDAYRCVPVDAVVLHWSDSPNFRGNSATWGTLNSRNRVCGLAIDDSEVLQMSNFYDDKVTWEGCSTLDNSINIEINGTQFDLWYNKACEIVNPTQNNALASGELQQKKEAVANQYNVSPSVMDWEDPRYETIMRKQEKSVLETLQYLLMYYNLTKENVTGHNKLVQNDDPGERFLECIKKKLTQ